jgi:predicted nuclease with TOPRIM domain
MGSKEREILCDTFCKGTKFIDILLKFASKFGIRVSKQIEVSDEIKNLKEKLDEALRQKQNVEDIKNKLEMDIKSHLENIEKLRQQVVEKNLPEFAKSLQEFERK